MKLIPILFSTPMVQAILNGNKSMTRRTKGLELASIYASSCKRFDAGAFLFSDKHSDAISLKRCPYGQPGDVLWVRETYALDYFGSGQYWHIKSGIELKEKDIVYKANDVNRDPQFLLNKHWKPNIHMPFEACRIFLRVKEIRVERLQDISREDCKREGITLGIDNGAFSGWHDRFCDLWQSINGADSWNANPWVWVISFERITDENEIADIRKQWNERRAK